MCIRDRAGKAVYDGFLELITECRSTGLTITLSTQSPLDFRTTDCDVMQAVVQNTATKLILQQADDESADKCARLVGSEETVVMTKQVERSFLSGVQGTGLGSEREGWTFIAHPDELKTLEVGEGYLSTHGFRGRVRVPRITVPRVRLPDIENRGPSPTQPWRQRGCKIAEEGQASQLLES